ncbi:MAG: hypothetical protein J6S24_08940, partial [Lentisphaeria bacterium]|nr:hypothetical protein [Lentisphaeria bacterium]
ISAFDIHWGISLKSMFLQSVFTQVPAIGEILIDADKFILSGNVESRHIVAVTVKYRKCRRRVFVD